MCASERSASGSLPAAGESTLEISVVIPTYKAELCLAELHARLTNCLNALGLEYEIIYVDDRSPDNSWSVLEQLVIGSSARAIRLSRNFGQHAAIAAGLSRSRGKWAVVMDCDLQDPPEAIAKLYQKAQSGYDIVLAKRIRRQHSIYRKLTSKLFAALLRTLSTKQFSEDYGSLSIISRTVIDEYLKFTERGRHYILILLWLGFKSTFIEYEHGVRFAGKSAYTLQTLFKHAVQGIFFHSTIGLYFIIYTGFSLSLLGLVTGVSIWWCCMVHSIAGVIVGCGSVIALILFIGGTILLSNGVVGLYIAQAFEQVMNRPVFVIEKEFCSPPD